MGNEDCNECILLAGGEAWRLKPDTTIPKPMLKLNNLTLLEYQLRWLLQHKFDHIIIASDKKYDIRPSFDPYIEWSIGDKRGTGGAVLIASDILKTKNFYLMNVDDLIFGYNPRLMLMGDYEAKILVSKPRIGFGRVELRQDLILGFREKPILDFYVSVGHYVFKKHIVEKYFPDIGNLEELVLPNLAERRILKAERLKGKWVTINTVKDLLEAQQILSQ
uniref:Putative nucleotidyltransferase n=1 Tax=viral metagenome TaxID=1070528 RepID=A0A6M3XPG5_9ZZZZ